MRHDPFLKLWVNDGSVVPVLIEFFPKVYQMLRQHFADKGVRFLSIFDTKILSSSETECLHSKLEAHVYATAQDRGEQRALLYHYHREAFTTELFMGYTRWNMDKAGRYVVKQ